MWQILDLLLTVFHVVLILFILLGWVFAPLRIFHLCLTTATLVSWFAGGLFYGFGYCFLTDWQWQVKRRLGEEGLPYSFVEYILEEGSGLDLPSAAVDGGVAVAGIGAFLLSLWLRVRGE